MAIKLLLIKEVEDLGLSGDIVSVRPGYARNFLLPRGVAVIADKNAIRKRQKLLEERRKQEARNKKESEKLAERLREITVKTSVKTDPEGHMYGSVSVLDIIRMLKEQQGIEIAKRCILLKHPIKTLGMVSIPLKLIGDVEAFFNLEVVREEEKESPEEAQTVEE